MVAASPFQSQSNKWREVVFENIEKISQRRQKNEFITEVTASAGTFSVENLVRAYWDIPLVRYKIH